MIAENTFGANMLIESELTAKGTVIAVVDAPIVTLASGEKAGEILLHFYRALGWNGTDYLDPSKVRTTKEIYRHLYDQMYEHCPDPVGVGMYMVNRGPGTDDYIKPGKVHLLEGWVMPEPETEPETEPEIIAK